MAIKNNALNNYLAQQLGLSVDVFDGQGGFWKEAEKRGISNNQINSLISGFENQFDKVTGEAKNPNAYNNLGITNPNGGGGISQDMISDFETRMSELQTSLTNSFQGQLSSQQQVMDDLRRRLAMQGRDNVSDAQMRALTLARYQQAGRSRHNLGSAFGTATGGAGGPSAGVIY